MEKLKVSVREKILIVEDVDLEKAIEITKDFEKSTLNSYPYIIYKSALGYYAGWDFINNKSIYCGTRSEKTSIDQVKEYINDQFL